MELTEKYLQKKEQYNANAILAVLLLGGFISLFSETILNVAFPKLMLEMNISATTVEWLTTGYVLVVAILVPVTAFLINTFTTKQLFLSAMILFFIGSLCAALSTSFIVLLISRLIQASGTGMLVPIMMNTALIVTPKERQGMIMALCGSVVTLGPALSPVVAGVLLQFFSWNSLFILLVIVSIIAILFGYKFLNNPSKLTKPKIDYLSIALSAIAFAGIVYSISTVAESSILKTCIIFIVGLIALIIFAKRQLSLKQPMLEIRTFKYPIFTIGIIIVIVIQMFIFSLNMTIPLVLQNGLKLSSFTSALVILPPIIIGALLNPVSGKVYDKFGGKIIIPAGMAVICIFAFILSRITSSIHVIVITLVYCFIMVGVSFAASNSQTTALKQLSDENQADGVAIINTGMQIAGALGSALFVGIMTSYQNIYLKNINNHADPNSQVNAIYSGFSHSIIVAVGLLAIGFILSLFISKKASNKNVNIS